MRFFPYIFGTSSSTTDPTATPTADAFWALDTTGADDEYIEDEAGSTDLTISSVLKVVGSPVSDSYWSYNEASIAHATAVDSALLSMPDADFTWAAWARLDSTGVARTVFSKGVRGSAATFEYALYVTDGSPNRFAFAVGNGSQAKTVTDTQVSVITGGWHFVACRFDKSQMKLGINVDMTGWVESAFTGTVHDNTNDLYVGIEYPSSLRWDGAINMVAMRKALLSDAQLNFWWRDGVGWRIPVIA